MYNMLAFGDRLIGRGRQRATCWKCHRIICLILLLETVYPLSSKLIIKLTLTLLTLAVLSIPPYTEGVLAQEPTPQPSAQGAVYVVQPGDSLWSIALRFRVSIQALTAANGISNADQLNVGDRLMIPGLEGIQGTLTTQIVPFGETLRSLSRRYRTPIETLIRLNHLTSPGELYAGVNLVIVERGTPSTPSRRRTLASGQSLLELAVQDGVSPWVYLLNNDLKSAAATAPGDVLLLPQSEVSGSVEEPPAAIPAAMPDAIQKVQLAPLPLVQGKAVVIEIFGENDLQLGGSLNERPLNFFFDAETGSYVSLQGVHAMAEPGLYPLVISATLPGGAQFAFSQSVFVEAGDYVYDPVLTVSPETIDPAVTRPEDAQWAALTAPVTPEKLWQGVFQSPAPPPYNDCWPSRFGSRRSYNGSAYIYFHTGLDFCGGVGTDILAPAAGRVVFAGPLTVRGNATVIDHGWGVYTGYLHQSEILVQVGDLVQPGQVIGKVGGTGRVTGPHLHWEVWVGGVQVDPMDWLLQPYPR